MSPSWKTLRTACALAVSSALLPIIGCGGGGGNTSGAATNSQGAATGRLAAKTIFLSRPSDVPIAIDAGSVTLSGRRAGVQPGAILLSNQGSGFIRKVTAVSATPTNTICQTTNAGLPDAFAELHAKAHPLFNRATVGDITSGVSGLTMKWVAAPQKSASTRDTDFSTLELDFGNLGISGGGKGSFSINGSVDFNASPELDGDVNTAPGDLFPSLANFNASIATNMTGTVTVAASGAGQIGIDHKWFDDFVGPPIEVGWLVFRFKLTVESDLEGEASGNVTHSQTVNASANAGISYTRGVGWTTTGSFDPSLGASETGVNAQFSVKFVPVKVTLSCELYQLVGPFAAIDANITAAGKQQLGTDPTSGDQVLGIQADVTGGLEASVGISADLPEAIADLLGLKGASATSPTKDFPLKSVPLFSHFFPLPGSAEIVVVDDGDPADDDDAFQVALDGDTLGLTAKGSTGSYLVNDLPPGSHTITVTYTDQGPDDETGDPPASLTIQLNNGLTFPDGSTSASQSNLPFDVAQSFTIVVPPNSKLASRGIRIQRVHRSRAAPSNRRVAVGSMSHR
ncbi:MAG TPA: hypothetical protein VKT77_11785 [Chthonomonadaceae bacterium]|nr:hypothetical protein [Chthonomonadaceae bacterium]